MKLDISKELLDEIHTHVETAYPEEGAGLMYGLVDGERRQVARVTRLTNAREGPDRYNRYLITPHDMMRGEQEAMRLGLDVIGVFHSHPDHPNLPSEFDRQWALPWFSYLITSVRAGKAVSSRTWHLTEDRSEFVEDTIIST